MLRATLLVVMGLSITGWGQQIPRSRHVVAFDSAESDLGTARAALSLPISTKTVLPSIAVSSSHETSAQPALLLVSSSVPSQPAILKSTTNLPERPSAKQQRIWWALTAVQHGAATFDAWSTQQSISSGNGYERNPLLKPFAGSPAIYPVIQVLPVGLDFLSNRMMRSRHGIFRKTWWLPQTLATAGFVWSGAHNLRVAHGN
jgi:hypothetical protein